MCSRIVLGYFSERLPFAQLPHPLKPPNKTDQINRKRHGPAESIFFMCFVLGLLSIEALQLLLQLPHPMAKHLILPDEH